MPPSKQSKSNIEVEVLLVLRKLAIQSHGRLCSPNHLG